jgi:outer membrane protein assembly factor BamA
MNLRVGFTLLFFRSLVFFIAMCVFNKAFTNPEDTLQEKKGVHKFKVGALPSMYYTPETSLGFGGFVYTFFKFNKYDTLCKKSISQSFLSYTLNKQFAFENDFQIWLKQNKFYISGAADYSRFPQYYYGIGNSTNESDKFMVSFDVFRIKTKGLVRLYNQVYAGLSFHHENLYNQDKQFEMRTAAMETYGRMGFVANGIGGAIMIDKRDNPLNPSNGSYFEASFTDYKTVLNNAHGFVSFVLDARKYYTLPRQVVWNGNFYLSLNKGDVPYKLLAEIGGPRFLRGYYRGRFRDNNMYVLQQEVRIPLYKRLGVALFGGIGAVGKTISMLRSNTVHYNYGAGLRIKVDKKNNANFRIDYGMTKDSHGLYIVFAEAF